MSANEPRQTKYDLVIFDLDGTILNTLDDLSDACNAALRKNGYPTHARDEVRTFIGSGVANLMRRALPEGVSDETRAKVLTDFKAHYALHAQDKTAPYPGVLEMLRALRGAGVHVAVNSNKFDEAVGGLCQRYFGDLVEFAAGELAGVPRKPAPDGANRILAHFGVDKSRAVYVGDSGVDMQTAQNAGLDSAWVSWGFRQRKELGGVEIPRAFDTGDALKQFLMQ